jgi:outer membrane receptor for ferric coprogen and ferric-rhodotorulic acid
MLDLELQNVFDAKYPEIRASGFINPGAPRTLRAAIRFADQP